MKIEALHIGMNVRHPQYGLGTVRTISEVTAEIQFNDGKRTVEPDAAGLEPAEPQVAVSGLNVPLKQFVEQTLAAAITKLGLEKPDSVDWSCLNRAARRRRPRVVLAHAGAPGIVLGVACFLSARELVRNGLEGQHDGADFSRHLDRQVHRFAAQCALHGHPPWSGGGSTETEVQHLLQGSGVSH